jgi:hypothetical protein
MVAASGSPSLLYCTWAVLAPRTTRVEAQALRHLDLLLLEGAAHAARCTARHGVGSYAEPPTMEWAAAVT